jgi:hypothetical protein
LVLLSTPAVDRLLRFRWTAARQWYRVAVGVLVLMLGWSLFLHGQGAYFTETTCWSSHPSVDAHPERLWDWSDPQFLAGVRSIPELSLSDFVIGRCPAVRG